MCFQNNFHQISLLTFVLVVQFCYTTQVNDDELTLQLDQIDSRSNIETSTSLPAEVSKETMDIITIIWYLSTFLALAAFFFLMACSDRRCGRNRRTSNNSNQFGDDQQCPPTPSPSYSQFAPPSYESVVKENCHIYVIPIDLKLTEDKTNSSTFSTATDCKINTINEMHKNSI